jgi:hypothetical protein
MNRKNQVALKVLTMQPPTMTSLESGRAPPNIH